MALILSALSILVVTIIFGGFLSSRTRGALNQLIDLQYTTHHEDWVSSGRPLGGRVTRKESSFWLSDFSAIAFGGGLVSETPGWIKNRPEAVAILRRYRKLFLGTIGSIFVILGAGALLVWALMRAG